MSQSDPSNNPVEIFYSYSHKDEKLRNRLETHLSILRQQGLIITWHDRKISAGVEWKHEIDTYLQKADIILLLVSPDFLASEYCYSVEMKQAIERHNRGEARVIPVILRRVHWEGAPFGKLEALPRDAKPVTGGGWHNQDEAFYSIAEGIRKVVEEIVKTRSVIKVPNVETSLPITKVKRSNRGQPNELLRRARHNKAWSQEKLAEKIGVSKMTVLRLERGEAIPNPYCLHKLCVIFEKTAQELGFE